MAQSAGRLRTLNVEGLFGSRDYEIDLNPTGPTVLTGTNGTGKSTLLRLVNAISAGDVALLSSAPVRRLELVFESGPAAVLAAEPSEPHKPMSITWGDRSAPLVPLVDLAQLPDWARETALHATRWDEDLDQELMDIASSSGSVPYSEFREVSDNLRRQLDDEERDRPEWFSELKESFPVQFVTDQRLVVESSIHERKGRSADRGRSARLAVEAASRDLSRQMRRVDSDYARRSQTQDRRFPRDVIAAMGTSEDISISELQAQLDEVETARRRLRAVGLLDIDDAYEPELALDSLEPEPVRPVIATFLKASLDKMAVLEELATRLQIFKSFLDDQFSGKSMFLSRQAGVRFDLEAGSSIPPSQLSSGEQQMMVLAYEILFRAPEGTLFIIDEPEISLHVLWQDTLIDRLTEMGRPSRLQFLMATHSPVLLAAHEDLERSLDDFNQRAPVPEA